MTKPTIFIISGGLGISGSQILQTALAQFLTNDIPITIVPQVREIGQLEPIIAQAESLNGVLVHTLVDPNIRRALVNLAAAHGIAEVDLLGTLLDQLTVSLGQNPVGQPGLYHKMRERDVKRVEAIEFTVNHDDGKRAYELHQADIVLTGVSRVGKTPLSIYLSTLGWKVANIPLVRNIDPPPELFEVDYCRVVGLMLDPGRLVAFRQRRSRHLGMTAGTSYTIPAEILEELDFAQGVFRRGQFAVINTTDKPVEENAEEIVALINRRLKLR